MVYLTPIERDFSWRQRVAKEVQAAKAYPKRWGWVGQDVRNMEKQLNEMSKKSEFLKEVFTDKEEDNRDIRPVPESMNHTYGWIANKEDFQNKIPDTMKLLSLPSHYKLVIPYDHPYWCYLRS
ncbi:uncharacterized protein LOC123685999 isoform X1 [Harmonia axyridis]|uniref:uncharacterized protein LOC123685999 isoform X1 n=1 Tax=Harmonia axyridis TaxID=115357 RepID=UPI001E27984F|nr:uncharacterized protein LOC123685999 isoform X1 [Harmonia axyridis]